MSVCARQFHLSLSKKIMNNFLVYIFIYIYINIKTTKYLKLRFSIVSHENIYYIYIYSF